MSCERLGHLNADVSAAHHYGLLRLPLVQVRK
jgi:hypothetical protein